MRSPKWIKLFPSDFWGDELVQELSALAACAYLALLTLAWRSKGTLREPLKALRRIGFKADEAEGLWIEIRDTIGWVEVDGGWTQPRLWAEWLEAEKTHAACSESGRKGGLKSGETRRKRAKGALQEDEGDPSETLEGKTKRSGSGSGSGVNRTSETSSPRGTARAAPAARGGGPRDPAAKARRVAELIDLLGQFPALQAHEGIRREWAEAIREQAERGRLPTERRARGILNEALVRTSAPSGEHAVEAALHEWWVSGRASPSFTYAGNGHSPDALHGSRLRDVTEDPASRLKDVT